MLPIRVTNVKGLRGDARNGVCYCGREFAGWPSSPWGNPFRPAAGFDAVAAYREWFLGRPLAEVDRALADLWEACGHGAKPLGCWCVDAVHGDGQPVVCHAQVLAELLADWLARQAPPPDVSGICLSLWQPWATLLVAGPKRIETRPWATEYRGPLLIHAAKKWDADLAFLAADQFRQPLESAGVVFEASEAACKRGWNLPFGAIVGRVQLVDCAPTGEATVSDAERAFGDFGPGRWAWVCEKPERFDRPVPFVGRQGLFRVGEAESRKPDTWAANPCGCRACSVCGFYGLAPKPVAVLPPAEQEPVMRAFGTMELREAQAFAAAGGQALHLHNIIVDRSRAPKCFVRDVVAGKPIAHLFDADAERLERTARNLGVKVIVVERPGQPGQHIDLCGGPLAKAMAMVNNPAEAKAIAAAFAEDAETAAPPAPVKAKAPTLFDEVPA